MSNELKAEIFATGKWNGMEFSDADLSAIAATFEKLGDKMRVPLKLGHNDEQPLTDGKPALGWVSKVWAEGGKLFANFTDVPAVVMDAIKKKLYKNVSIELDCGVKHKDDFYQYVLSGVALLGADIPAVNTLADLTAYMSRNSDGYSRKSIVTFTYSEGSKMSEELKAAQDEAAKLKAELAKVREEQETAKFTAEKTALESRLNGLVKDGVLIPAQREKLMSGVSKDNIESIKFSVDAIAAGATKPVVNSNQTATNGGTQEKSTGTPSELLFAKAKKVQMENSKLSFSQAQRVVMQAEPELAREYMTLNGG